MLDIPVSALGQAAAEYGGFSDVSSFIETSIRKTAKLAMDNKWFLLIAIAAVWGFLKLIFDTN